MTEHVTAIDFYFTCNKDRPFVAKYWVNGQTFENEGRVIPIEEGLVKLGEFDAIAECEALRYAGVRFHRTDWSEIQYEIYLRWTPTVAARFVISAMDLNPDFYHTEELVKFFEGEQSDKLKEAFLSVPQDGWWEFKKKIYDIIDMDGLFKILRDIQDKKENEEVKEDKESE